MEEAVISFTIIIDKARKVEYTMAKMTVYVDSSQLDKFAKKKIRELEKKNEELSRAIDDLKWEVDANVRIVDRAKRIIDAIKKEGGLVDDEDY